MAFLSQAQSPAGNRSQAGGAGGGRARGGRRSGCQRTGTGPGPQADGGAGSTGPGTAGPTRAGAPGGCAQKSGGGWGQVSTLRSRAGRSAGQWIADVDCLLCGESTRGHHLLPRPWSCRTTHSCSSDVCDENLGDGARGPGRSGKARARGPECGKSPCPPPAFVLPPYQRRGLCPYLEPPPLGNVVWLNCRVSSRNVPASSLNPDLGVTRS